MASTHNANFKLHLDITAHADDDNDSFNYTTVMKNPNPNPTSVSSSTPPLFCSFFHSSTNLPPFNHHLGVNVNASHEESRTENMAQPLGSSRWNPTPEQLLALEEMYRRGMRTPSTEQIQLIAGQLRRFGKIEGKNVFYWFQNHKARERQKRRRESLETQEEKHHHHDHYHSHETTDLEKKESGMRKGTIYDVEHTKNWASSSSNWRKHSEEFVSMHTSVVSSNTENGPQRWPQLHSKELQLQRKFNFNLNHHREIFNIVKINQNDQLQETTTTTRTLELFPLHSDENESSKRDNDDDDSMKMNITATINNSGSSFSPRQYIEFLPLKN